MITITEGKYKGLTVEEPEYKEYKMYAAWGPLVGNTDPVETLVLPIYSLCWGWREMKLGSLSPWPLNSMKKVF